MNYEGDLVSLVIPIIYFKLWLIIIKSWGCIGVCLVLGLIGWHDIELGCVDFDSWGVCLRCKCYKDGEWFSNVPYYEIICKCANLTYMNCNERTILMKFLLSYDDDDYVYIWFMPYDLQ